MKSNINSFTFVLFVLPLLTKYDALKYQYSYWSTDCEYVLLPLDGDQFQPFSSATGWQLTDPQLKVVEGVLVDLQDALVQRNGKVGQGAQVAPLVFALLRRRW